MLNINYEISMLVGLITLWSSFKHFVTYYTIASKRKDGKASITDYLFYSTSFLTPMYYLQLVEISSSVTIKHILFGMGMYVFIFVFNISYHYKRFPGFPNAFWSNRKEYDDFKKRSKK